MDGLTYHGPEADAPSGAITEAIGFIVGSTGWPV